MNIDEKLKTIREEAEKRVDMTHQDSFFGFRNNDLVVSLWCDKVFDFYESHIRRLLEEQEKEIEKFILDYMKENGGCMDCNLSGELLAKFDHTPATDKLQISK